MLLTNVDLVLLLGMIISLYSPDLCSKNRGSSLLLNLRGSVGKTRCPPFLPTLLPLYAFSFSFSLPLLTFIFLRKRLITYSLTRIFIVYRLQWIHVLFFSFLLFVKIHFSHGRTRTILRVCACLFVLSFLVFFFFFFEHDELSLRDVGYNFQLPLVNVKKRAFGTEFFFYMTFPSPSFPMRFVSFAFFPSLLLSSVFFFVSFPIASSTSLLYALLARIASAILRLLPPASTQLRE